MDPKYRKLLQRLDAAMEDAPSSWMYDILSDASDVIEEMANQRRGWRVVAGGETFTTHDQSVAEDWQRDGLDVEQFFI